MTTQTANAVTFVLLGIALTLSLLAFWTSSSAMEEEQLRKAMSGRRTSHQVAGGTSHQPPPRYLHDSGKLHPSEQSVDLMRDSYLEALSAHPHYVVLVPVQESSARGNHITHHLRMENVQEAQAEKSTTELSPDSLPSGLTSSLAMMDQIELRKSPSASVADDEQTYPMMGLTQKNDKAKSTMGSTAAAGSSSWPLITKFPFAWTAIFVLGLAIINFLDRLARKKEVMAKFRDDDSDVSSFSTGLKYSNSPRDVGYGTIACTALFDGSFDKFDL